MPKYTEVKNNLTNGELSPRAAARFDFVKYPNSVKKAENFLLNQLGGASYCPGTRYVAEVKDSTKRTRIIPFQFNSAQAYLLELGNLYSRFYTNHGQIASVNSALKLLCHFDGLAGQNTYTAETGQIASFNTNAQLETSSPCLGTAALNCNISTGTDIHGGGPFDFITFPDSADYSFGTGNFTLDFRLNIPTLQNYTHNIMGQYVDANNYWVVSFNDNTKKMSVIFVIGGVTMADYIYAAGSTFNAATWYNFRIVRNSTNFYIFQDGVSQTLTANTAISTNNVGNVASSLFIGQYGTGSGNLIGYLDELQIYKGSALNTSTASYSPVTTPYGGGSAWVTAYNYVINDSVTYNGIVYTCLVAHTSNDFATDLAALKWSATSAYEITTVYASSDVPNIQYAQNADVMYLYHPSYPIQKLTRVSAVSFTIAQVNLVRGPFFDDNITAVTLTPSAATGTGITVTASAATFQTGHVGAYFKIHSAVVKITAVSSETVATGDVQAEPSGAAGNIGGTTGYTDWAESKYSDYRGWPATGTFHQQRHVLAGSAGAPQDEDASVVGSFENFKVDANDDSAAFSATIVSDQVNPIKFLNSDVDSLQNGTSGGIFTTDSSPQGSSVTASNISIKKDSSYGATAIRPVRVSSFLYYIHKSLYKIFEHVYNYLSNRHVSSDMTLLADHILREGQGAYEMAYQQMPNDRIWIVRNDGQIAIMTRNPEQEVTGWARRIGGTDTTYHGLFESISCIQQDSQDDEVWVITKRTINGSTKRFVEYFMPEYYTYNYEPVLLDASLSYDAPKTITGATKANPVVITAVAHGFSNGDYVRIDKVVGMTNLNAVTYIVAAKTTDTFQLTTTAGVNVNGTAYSTYVSGGEVRKMATNVTGLSHLNGETVGVQADGLDVGDFTVSGGTLSPALTNRAGIIHVGLRYTPKIQFLKFSGQTNEGTGQTKQRRIYQAVARVSQSMGFSIGQDENTYSRVETPNGASGDIYSGDIDVGKGGFETWFAVDTEMFIKSTKAEPLNLLALITRQEIKEVE